MEQLEGIENEANSKVAEKIGKQIEKKESLLSSKKRLLSSKDGLWSKPQIEEELESVKNLNNVINSLKTLKDEKESVSKKRILNRCKKNIIRLKLRKLGSGRTSSMDLTDEQFLVESITEKATAHGRRHDSVMYLNHRVKKRISCGL